MILLPLYSHGTGRRFVDDWRQDNLSIAGAGKHEPKNGYKGHRSKGFRNLFYLLSIFFFLFLKPKDTVITHTIIIYYLFIIFID